MHNGVILLLIAMSLTPGIDGVSKQLSATHSPFLVAFLRYLAAGLVALAVARTLGQPIRVPKEGRLGQVVRTCLLVAAMTCLIVALSMVPMGLAAGGFLIAPLVSTAIGILFLGERATAPRLAGGFLSLMGATIITRPEAGIEVGTLFALLGGALLGVYLAATRGSRATGGALATLAVQCLLGALLLSPMAFLDGVPEPSWSLLAAVLALGVLSAMAHFLTVAAFERCESSILSPFLYFNLATALAVGYLWFGEWPGLWSLLGLVLIAGGGLVTLVPPARVAAFVDTLAVATRDVTVSLQRVAKQMTTQSRSAIMIGVINLGGDHECFVASERTQA